MFRQSKSSEWPILMNLALLVTAAQTVNLCIIELWEIREIIYIKTDLCFYVDKSNSIVSPHTRPSSVNQISLVHNHDKAVNTSYPRDNINTPETQLCE